MSSRVVVFAVLWAFLPVAGARGQAQDPGGTRPQPGLSAQQASAPASQMPIPAARVTFNDAIAQAIARNPTVRQAATDILRAQGLLHQARSVVLPNAGGNLVTIGQRETVFNGTPITPPEQLTANLGVTAPLFAPVLWAQRAQAADLVRVSEVNAADVRRQIAVATAQSYLAIIARRRVFEADLRARDVSRAHFDLAHQQRVAGAGSLLNELRAQQQLSANDVLVEQSSLDVYRAQEALGVLVGGSGAVDTIDDPVLLVPGATEEQQVDLAGERTDVRVAAAREAAAMRVWKDSWKDWLPTANGLFQPQFLQPSTLFTPATTWRAQVAVSVPLFDAGFRRSVRAQREALFTESQLQHESVLRQARSDVRTADESVKSADRALANARAAADQARQVLDIVNVSFKAGAATEIEVIDAQRALLDAETSVAVAEDAQRQARLALLVAVGRFPS